MKNSHFYSIDPAFLGSISSIQQRELELLLGQYFNSRQDSTILYFLLKENETLLALLPKAVLTKLASLQAKKDIIEQEVFSWAWQERRHDLLEILPEYFDTTLLNINKLYPDSSSLEIEGYLLQACIENNLSLINVLLKYPTIEVNKLSNFLRTISLSPLAYCCKHGHLEAAELLLKDPKIEINKLKYNIASPLTLAIRNSQIEIVKLLLKQPNIDINIIDEEGYNALYWACKLNNSQITQLLLIQPHLLITHYDLTTGNLNPLLWGSKKGDLTLVKTALQHLQFDINTSFVREKRQVPTGRRMGNAQLVQTISNIGITPLIWACKLGHKEIVEVLINDPRTDINLSGIEGDTSMKYGEVITPLGEACKNGHEEIVTLLLADKRLNFSLLPTPPVSDKGGRYLLCSNALTYGYKSIVRRLITNPDYDSQVEINYTERANGQNLLHFLCSAPKLWPEHLEIAELLLNYKQKYTPYYFFGEATRTIAYNQPDLKGQTPISLLNSRLKTLVQEQKNQPQQEREVQIKYLIQLKETIQAKELGLHNLIINFWQRESEVKTPQSISLVLLAHCASCLDGESISDKTKYISNHFTIKPYSAEPLLKNEKGKQL